MKSWDGAVTLRVSRSRMLRLAPQPAPEPPISGPLALPDPDTGELDRPMSRAEAAAWLGINQGTLSQWAAAGWAPCVYVGSIRRYTKRQLAAALEAGTLGRETAA